MIKKGTYTALVTPFLNGKVDFKSLEKLVKHQLANNIDGFIVNGTTGESPTVNAYEMKEIFQCVKSLVSANFPLIIGTGTNSTETTIENTKVAKNLGAEAALVVVPYYNKPPQQGLFEHFKKVAEESEFSIILYNVPGRTVTALAEDTISKLSKVKGIIGIKEASGDLEFHKKIKQITPSNFLHLSGDDETAPRYAQLGGDGVISVVSHVFPREFSQVIQDGLAGKPVESFNKYINLTRALFAQANPIPVKSALHMMGIIASDELRLPLCQQTDEQKNQLKKCLKELSLV